MFKIIFSRYLFVSKHTKPYKLKNQNKKIIKHQTHLKHKSLKKLLTTDDMSSVLLFFTFFSELIFSEINMMKIVIPTAAEIPKTRLITNVFNSESK